jgi:hypothetical protein
VLERSARPSAFRWLASELDAFSSIVLLDNDAAAGLDASITAAAGVRQSARLLTIGVKAGEQARRRGRTTRPSA